ncbi:hypothetical protein Tsubulata_004403 [Turnera subulata]|uniref:Uncharacterized protein n=1 Tax=Turnera subulata TaxID=218843 RepID=A0A9Q0J491_9ROSI|nr:hypothetical protein Tsubulata_004403 [Turnera subulata]
MARVLAKETHLHLAQRELNKLKDQAGNAETTEAQALAELEKARRTVEELTQKLKIVTESKDSAIKETEAAKNRAKQIEETKGGISPKSDAARKKDLESARERYMTVFSELDTTKQELRKILQECDASLEAKSAAFNQAAEAETVAKVNVDKVSELSKEISALQETIGQLKLAALEAHQEQAKTFADKDIQRQSYKSSLEASTNKLLALKKEIDPELAKNLGKQLTETTEEIGMLKKQKENSKASDEDSVKVVTSELDGAKDSLQKVAEEESSLRSLVESLKLKLENVKKEHAELKEKEAETESITGNLHLKLRKSKSELEAAIEEESKVRGVSEEMISTLQQLWLEAENARREAEEKKSKAEELKKVADATRIALEEAEKKLTVALEEAEEAKTAEAMALEEASKRAEMAEAAKGKLHFLYPTDDQGQGDTIGVEYAPIILPAGNTVAINNPYVAGAGEDEEENNQGNDAPDDFIEVRVFNFEGQFRWVYSISRRQQTTFEIFCRNLGYLWGIYTGLTGPVLHPIEDLWPGFEVDIVFYLFFSNRWIFIDPVSLEGTLQEEDAIFEWQSILGSLRRVEITELAAV